MGHASILIKDSTKSSLDSMKKINESYNAVIERMIKDRGDKDEKHEN